MGIPLGNEANQVDDVPLLDLMNAFRALMRDNVTMQQVRYSSAGADLGDVLSNMGLDQVVNPVHH